MAAPTLSPSELAFLATQDNHSSSTYAIICVFFGLALLCCTARFATRKFIVGSFGFDDLLAALAMAASCFLLWTIRKQFDAGVGKRAVTLSLDRLSDVNKYAWISQIVYYITINLVKLSILALYLRLAPQGKYRTFIKGVFVVVLAQGISCTVGTVFLCTPISAVWNVKTFPAGCINILNFNYFNASFGIFTDVVLTVLPIPILLKLQINTAKKVGLVIVFSFGLIAIAGTIGRLAATVVWAHSPDFTWTFTPILLYTGLECNMAIISASLPSLRPLFKKVVDFGSSHGISTFKKSANKTTDRQSSVRLEEMGTKSSTNGKSTYVTEIRSLSHDDTKMTRTATGESDDSVARLHSMSVSPDREKVVKTVEYRVEYN